MKLECGIFYFLFKIIKYFEVLNFMDYFKVYICLKIIWLGEVNLYLKLKVNIGNVCFEFCWIG